MPLPNSIAAAADDLRAWRRDFHQHPELGYQETRTAREIAAKLRAFGLDAVHEGIGVTGVVGVLHGRSGPGGEAKAIMLRSDIDALPITEANDFAHKSAHPGKMHACGHDGHLTMLLGAAQHLAQTRAFDGTVYFCFQPAEEGGAGAKAMLEDGLFERFPCKAIYGMHNWPGVPMGTFTTRRGPLLAAADEFRIRITGSGSHAARPHESRDPILCGAAMVQALQSIVSRRVDPLETAVLSVTRFDGGEAFNVIPETAMIGGTVRTFDEAVYALICEEMERIVSGIAAAHGATAEIDRGDRIPYPPTVNDDAQTDFCLEVAREIAGEGAVADDAPPTMGGEDFSFFAREKPACFMLIGNGETATLHHPRYDFNDDTAPWGVAYWAKLAERALPAR